MTVVRRYEFTDQGWALIEPLLPQQDRGGKWNDHRTVMNGMFWVLRSGSAWRGMPEQYGKWQAIYDRFVRSTSWALSPSPSSADTCGSCIRQAHPRLLPP